MTVGERPASTGRNVGYAIMQTDVATFLVAGVYGSGTAQSPRTGQLWLVKIRFETNGVQSKPLPHNAPMDLTLGDY